MPFDHAALLAPVSDAQPCGGTLDELPHYEDFRAIATSAQQPDWGRHLERAVELARASRDLRAWVWLTRAALSAEGIPGLAAGLQLISEGLERYWDTLPPQHADEPDPRERFMRRLFTLTQLGVTNFSCPLDALLASGPSLAALRTELDAAVINAVPDAATRRAVEQARAAIGRIGALFVTRFGPGQDPQLGFETLLHALDAVERKFAAAGLPRPAAGAAEGSIPEGPAALPNGAIHSRDDVVRVLNEVLEYYRANEPSSPVPLLVLRAKRLVPLSFLDAIKELAPTGLKELQAVAGASEEKK
ncbi:ImpA family type VI secretion system protein [Falsiroseomonas sp.]|uniref:type VI secretion system protein TssA n=1 Tax=Falsiroseomonas sp. TaxID=2870721 RepID=UPI00356ABECE